MGWSTQLANCKHQAATNMVQQPWQKHKTITNMAQQQRQQREFPMTVYVVQQLPTVVNMMELYRSQRGVREMRSPT